MRERGISARHARFMSWSKRKRGRDQRTHMKTKRTMIVLAKRHRARATQRTSELEIAGLFGSMTLATAGILSTHGMCQPPKKRQTQTALVVIIPAYSARKKSAKRIEEYSVW